MLVTIRLARIFRADNAANFFFDALACHVFAITAFEAALEKELELKEPLRRVHILIRRRAADGGLMHVNVFGNVAQHHRLELADPMVKKLLLKLENTLRDSK